jgi:flagellar hook-basal body complex protein FliE
MIEALTAMAAIISDLGSLAAAAGPSAAPAAPAAAAPAGSFADLFSAAVARLDANVAAANTKATAFASGADDVPLSDVMVALEQANLALQMAANVRDRVVSAYTNVMNMQV